MNKLYVIKTNDFGYDDYNGFVICAQNKTEAELFLEKELKNCGGNFKNSLFTSLGQAHKNIKKGIILSSFNAG